MPAYATKKSNGGVLRTVIIMVAAVSVCLAAALLYAEMWPNEFPGNADAVVFVSRGESFHHVADTLEQMGVIANRSLFMLVARLHGGGKVQVGRYVLKSGWSNGQILEALRTGRGIVLVPVTIREGLSIRRQAREYARSLGVDSSKFAGIASDSDVVRKYGLEGSTLEGYLMPDTYAFSWQTDEAEIVKRMVNAFKKFYGDSIATLASETGRSMKEIVTMASIVEGETRVEMERPIVAGVYYNRLMLGMRLEADPTIQYTLEDGPRRLLYADLKTESPYNTYLHAGLPPGPISSPGRSSLLAAAQPAHHQYLYFVANGRGGHTFSVTYNEHLRNVSAARRLRGLANK
jgi:UPF0755 protein